MNIQAGDFAAVRTASDVGRLIWFGELLNGDGFRDYEHALVCVGHDTDETPLVLEAEPSGSRIRRRRTPIVGDIWSTGVIPLTTDQRTKATIGSPLVKAFTGVPYSFLDYGAIALHRLRVPIPHLQEFISSSKHEICSQLVDAFMAALGVQLFDDKRWPGFVTPAEIGNLLLSKGGKPFGL